jgi:ribonuclease G
VNNELVIDVAPNEVSIALLEDKQLVELNREKGSNKFSVGDIYLGRVRKIMPGLNAAFVDVGYERDAFLHYLDLGPQFRSLSEYIGIALSGESVPVLDKFKCLPDINKNGKITEVLKQGQTILVQVAKEPISTKGPRISSEISIAGRNIVLMPFYNKVSISQKIKSREERDRLKRLIMSIKPKNYGVIIRTVAKNLRVAVLDAELKELVDKWERAFESISTAQPPKLVIGELSRTTAILRDLLNSTFHNIYINDVDTFNETRHYITSIAPEREGIVKLYKGRVPVFEQFGVEKQIKSLFGRTVTIRSGAYLIIEHTEALHVIDVNSGNRAKKNNDQETNALEVNMIAAEEIARQLRLRDMGGIIVVDFIDMHSQENRHKVFEYMKQCMAADRTKHNILPLSKFGLMQITRQRVRPEMTIEVTESCPTCNGTGKIGPSVLIVEDIENQLQYHVKHSESFIITIKLHPFVAAYYTKGLFSRQLKWWFKYKRFIKVKSLLSMGVTEFKFVDKLGEPL